MSNDTRAVHRRDFLRTLATTSAAAVAGQVAWPAEGLALTSRPHMTSARTGAQREFRVAVLGDSVSWGQGLLPEQKYAARVQDFLLQRLNGRPVSTRIFAHSGAVIARSAVEDATHANRFGELPDHWPSITAQVDAAQAFYAAQENAPGEVDVILLDGGINDVSITRILNPALDAATIRSDARRLCVEPMRDSLVPRVLAAFPGATVVLANYFPIVSERSDLVEIAILLGALGVLPGIPAHEILAAVPTIGVAVAPVIAAAVAITTAALRTQMVAQSRAFHEEVTAGFRTIALQPAGEFPRIAFADAGFGDEHAYGVPDTSLLFRIGDSDPVSASRAAECGRYPGSPADYAMCRFAQMGHPNARGAARYADAINRELNRYVWKFLGQKLLSIRVAPYPSLVAGAASTMTVFTEDRETRQAVAGDVYIGSSHYRTNQPFTHVLCAAAAPPSNAGASPFDLQPPGTPTPSSALLCDSSARMLQVSAPGYAVSWENLDPYGSEAPFVREEIQYRLANGDRWRARLVRRDGGVNFEHYRQSGAFSHYDFYMSYLTQGGSAWDARVLPTPISGTYFGFRHAPNGDWGRAHDSLDIIYLDWMNRPRRMWVVERNGRLVFFTKSP